MLLLINYVLITSCVKLDLKSDSKYIKWVGVCVGGGKAHLVKITKHIVI